MKRNCFVKRLLFPPLAIILLLIAVSAAALIRIFLDGLETTIPACVCYVISFYTLCVTCAFCWKTLPRYWRSGRNRLCACILLTVNLALSAAVLMMVYSHRGLEYPGVLIYAMALYTFYVTISAIVELVRFRKYRSPVLSMTKIIKTASALFSLLLLETAMLSRFGTDMPSEHRQIMIMATGGGIAAAVIGMASYMIVCTTNEIRSLQ